MKIGRVIVHPVGIPGKVLALEIEPHSDHQGPGVVPATLTEAEVMELTDAMRKLVFAERSARR